MSTMPSATTVKRPDDLEVLTRLLRLEEQLASARRAVDELAEVVYDRMTRPTTEVGGDA